MKILIRAITNAAIDLQGRQARLRSLNAGDKGDQGEGDEGDPVDHRMKEPVAEVMMRELEEALEAGLERLPLLQRAALEMKSTGHTLQEIAETLAITVSNAGVLIYRARQSVAQFLAPYLEDTAR